VNYPHRVTFQQPTEARTPAGGFSSSYADLADLSDLPARIVPVVGQEDEQADRMVLDADRFTIVVQGDREVERPMRVVSDYLDLELSVIRVQRPVLYGSALTNATIVTAERITAAVAAP
jgi:head-tail adaptor